MIKILLLEDDIILGKAVYDFLRSKGFDVEWFKDTESVVFLGYDLFLVDWVLKGKNGIDFIKSLKKQKQDIPTIIMTVKSSLDDKLSGFDVGVDDYITKPFEPKELLARIKAVLKRYYKDSAINIGEEIVIDIENKTVLKNSKEVGLTKKEFALLEVLLKNRPKPMNYDFLIDYVWGSEGSYETLKTHIYSIRKKIGKGIIASVKGVGYKIND